MANQPTKKLVNAQHHYELINIEKKTKTRHTLTQNSLFDRLIKLTLEWPHLTAQQEKQPLKQCVIFFCRKNAPRYFCCLS